METVVPKSEERKTRSEIAEILQEIALKIDKGVVNLIQGEESVELALPETLILEIKVEEKTEQNNPKKMQLAIELEWYEEKEKESEKTKQETKKIDNILVYSYPLKQKLRK